MAGLNEEDITAINQIEVELMEKHNLGEENALE